MAGQTAQVLNVSSVASDVGADRTTVTEYIRLLEDLFLVQQLPAWGTTLRSLLRVATPLATAAARNIDRLGLRPNESACLKDYTRMSRE